MKYILLITLAFLVIFSSCFYDNEEELYPHLSICNTDSMSYSTDIVPILNDHCLGCHSASANQGGVTMEGYDAVIPYVTDNRFLKSIKHENGVSQMPKNTNKLDSCTIAKVAAWIDQGALNN